MCRKLAWIFGFFLMHQVVFSQSDSIYFISDITLAGNTKTKDDIIFREITLSVYDTLSLTQLTHEIEATQNNLLNTSLFNFVTVTKTLNKNKVSILIILEERWYLWPYPIFEYADRNFNIWLKEKEYDRLNYGLHIIKYNFRGRREILNFKVRLGFREQYQFYYENPYLDKEKKFGLYFGIAKFRQKEIPVKTDSNIVMYYNDDHYIQNEIYADIGLFLRKHYYLTHHFNLGFRESSVNDSVLFLNPDYHNPSDTSMKLLKLSYTLDFDKRDSKIYPLIGQRFFASISQLGLGIYTAWSKSYFQMNLGAQLNYKMHNRWYASNTFKFKTILNNTPPFIFKNGLGYDDFIRGYEFYVIEGNNYSLLSNDIKFNFLPKKVFNFEFIPTEKFNKTFLSGFVNLFFDVGYVNSTYNSSGNYMSNELLFGYGVGIDFVTYYDKILRINYAINKFNEKNVYLHFKIPF